MFFKHEHILQARSGDLNDTSFFEHIFPVLLQNRRYVQDYPAMLRKYLLDLPPAEDLAKIVSSFHAIAVQNKCQIDNFEWWEIVKHDRIIFASLTRNDQKITVAFWWRESAKEESLRLNTASQIWLHDTECSGGFRMQFEAPTYQEVKAEFDAWLKRPLQLPIGWKT